MTYRQALFVCLLVSSACGNRDADKVTDESREFHGDPSSIICGKRWSHDNVGFLCENSEIALGELASFDRLLSVHLSNVMVSERAVPQLASVRSLVLHNVDVAPETIAEAFPGLESITVSGYSLEISKIPPMPRLAHMSVRLAPPPSPSALARHAALRTLVFSNLNCDACEERLADEVRKLRPDVVIRTAHLP